MDMDMDGDGARRDEKREEERRVVHMTEGRAGRE